MSPLDDGQESRVVNSSSDILLVECENRNPRPIDGLIIHLCTDVLRVLNPRVEVGQVKHEHAFGPNLVTERLKGLVRIRGRGKIVECRPEAEQRVKSATQAKQSHVRSAHVCGDTRRPKVPPGDAEHFLRLVSARDTVTSFHQRKVDGESSARYVEDFTADGMAKKQVPEERIRPGGSLRIVHSVVVLCDGPIPTGVGPSVLSSREPHGQ